MLWGSKNSVAKIRKKIHNLTFYSTKTFFLPTKPFHFSIYSAVHPFVGLKPVRMIVAKKIREALLRVSRKAFVLIVRIVQITTAVPLVATISMEFDWPMVS